MEPVATQQEALRIIQRIQEKIQEATGQRFRFQLSVHEDGSILLGVPRGFTMKKVGATPHDFSFVGASIEEAVGHMKKFFEERQSLEISLDEDGFQFHAFVSYQMNTFKVADVHIGTYAYHDSLED